MRGRDHGRAKAPEVQQHLVVGLGLASPAHVRQLFDRLARDHRIDELRAYCSAAPRLEAIPHADA